MICYYDLSLEPIKKDIKILSKTEIKDTSNIPKTTIKGKVYSGKRDENDNIVHHEEVATEENSNTLRLLKNMGEMSLFSIVGGGAAALCVGASAPVIAIGAGVGAGIAFIKNLFS